MNKVLSERGAGVLLHLTSLPGGETFWGGNTGSGLEEFGTLGKQAYNFIDFLASCGFRIWQMLPVVPTDLSPYQALSVHAGNPELISLDDLIERGWINAEDIKTDEKNPESFKLARARGANRFYELIDEPAHEQLKNAFNTFCEDQSYWLKDYALFMALRHKYEGASWVQWPQEVRRREPGVLYALREEMKKEICVYKFEQFAFFTQWKALRKYAAEKDIALFGDMPIFVGHDSADVWAQQQYFQLDDQGKALEVAGVPPDDFSENGQRWGNPHYAWDVMEADGFQWWLARLRTQLELFDLIRIDHFRGFEAYWSIPGDSEDAREGKWVKAPGHALLTEISKAFPELPLVAENLGLITEEVERLRHDFNIPGMAVLQFAFGGKSDNPYLPHNLHHSDFVYTGTHDNNTTVGWYHEASEEIRKHVKDYCFNSGDEMPWLLNKLALCSVGNHCIIPMQDLLALDGAHRMNMPGTVEKNWAWKFNWDQVPANLVQDVKSLLEKYNRLKKVPD